MGKNAGKIDIENDKSKSKVGRVNSKKIQKAHVTSRKKGGMDLETTKDRFEKKYDDMIERKNRPTKKSKQQFEPTPRPEFTPDTFKGFEKQYEASMSTKSMIAPGMTKGQKRRTLKKEKLEKKKLFEQYLSNIKNKKNNSSLFSFGDFGQDLESIEFDIGEAKKKEEEAKHKGVSSKAKQNVGNEEITRTQKILQHQGFLSNPLATIKQHVINTISLQEAQEAKNNEANKDSKKKKNNKEQNMMME